MLNKIKLKCIGERLIKENINKSLEGDFVFSEWLHYKTAVKDDIIAGSEISIDLESIRGPI